MFSLAIVGEGTSYVLIALVIHTRPDFQILVSPWLCMHITIMSYQLMSPLVALVAPSFDSVTVNEFTPLTIRCYNVVPNNVGRVQIFNPNGEMVGVISYDVPNATREFGGTYSCVATSQITANITATTTTDIIVRCKVYNNGYSSI